MEKLVAKPEEKKKPEAQINQPTVVKKSKETKV